MISMCMGQHDGGWAPRSHPTEPIRAAVDYDPRFLILHQTERRASDGATIAARFHRECRGTGGGSVAPTSPSRCFQRLIQLNASPLGAPYLSVRVGNHRMPTDRVAAFTVELTRHLDVDGHKLGPLPEFAANPVDLVPLYQAMVLTRTFDAKAVALQRTGRLGTFASSLGQEGVGVGAASAMAVDDVLVPSFRDQAAQLWRGVTPVELLLYWGGDERGSNFAVPRADFPVSVPVGSHVPHAAGVALAMKLHHEARAALCIIGGGATSKGDFYEALNVAGVWHLPLVILVCNNQWSISVPRSAQSAAQTLAQKAVAVGIPGEQVDGNDVIAVRTRTERALARARAGGGASLIEALTTA